MTEILMFRPRFSSGNFGRKTHISIGENRLTLCEVERRYPHLLMDSGDDQPLEHVGEWLGADWCEIACKRCSRKAMTAFHDAQARAAKAQLAQQAQEGLDA